MARAEWNGAVVAESEVFEVVDGNVYFPATALDQRFVKASATQTVCGWKGTASYYTLSVNGKENADAAWYYADPKPAAANIRGHIAFWKGVTVSK